MEAVLEEKSSHQTSKQSSIDHSEPEEFANENHQFTEDQNEQDEKYIIKMIMPYVPGENIKNMFANLLDLLDAPRRGFVNIARSHSKRAIVIECNSERVKQHFRKQESEKTIYASHLTDSVSYYNMPSSINIPIQFEYWNEHLSNLLIYILWHKSIIITDLVMRWLWEIFIKHWILYSENVFNIWTQEFCFVIYCYIQQM